MKIWDGGLLSISSVFGISIKNTHTKKFSSGKMESKTEWDFSEVTSNKIKLSLPFNLREGK